MGFGYQANEAYQDKGSSVVFEHSPDFLFSVFEPSHISITF
jgi:hypothetical protein